jgi:hypothetical protein
MSSDSTYKPRNFTLGSRIRFHYVGERGDRDASGEGRVFGTRALGDGTYTLVVERDNGAGKIDMHESWCERLPEPVAAGLPASLEVEESVIEEIRKRRDAGRKKYGTTMERSDLSVVQWIQHAKEEALDLAIYLEKLKREVTDDLTLTGTEHLTTFGGEGAIRDGTWDEYGLDLGVVNVYGLSPAQAIQLACTLVDHLVRNGHDFELRENAHQDQRLALVCTDAKNHDNS